MERYIACAGKKANSEGLATVVTNYWHSLKDKFGGPDRTNLDETNPTRAPADHELAPRTAREWFRLKGYCWADLKKGVYKDGHERSNVVAYRNHVFLPSLAALEPTFVRWTYPDPTRMSLSSFTPKSSTRYPPTNSSSPR